MHKRARRADALTHVLIALKRNCKIPSLVLLVRSAHAVMVSTRAPDSYTYAPE